MSKITVFSDLHIHNYKKYDIKGSRLNNTLDVLRQIFKHNKTYGIKWILFPGDFYDQQKAIPTVVINKTIETLQELFDEHPDQKIIAISGNHDHATKNLIHKKSETVLSHLAEIFPRQFLLIDDSVHKIKELGVNVFGIPYYEYKEHFIEQLVLANCERDENNYTGINILMIHQSPEHANPFIPSDIKAIDPLFKGFDLVLCGHIHSYEKLTDNFYIVGSPLHRDLGDEGKKKGFLVWDTDLMNLGPEFFHLNQYPVFKRSKNPDPEDPDYVVPIIEIDTSEDEEEFDSEKFTVDNTRKDILYNYWEDVDGKDKQLLELGQKFIS